MNIHHDIISLSLDKEDVLYINNGISYNQEKEKIMPFAVTWIDLKIVIQGEVSQKEKRHIISFICET